MAETEHIVHETGSSDSSSGMGFFLGMIMLVVVLMILFFYGLPILRNMTSNSGPTVNIPDKVNVNVQQQPAGK